MFRILTERESCAYLLTLVSDDTEPDCLIQSDWDYPDLASLLGCPWALHECKDPSRAIAAAVKWIDDNALGYVVEIPETASEWIDAYFYPESE